MHSQGGDKIPRKGGPGISQSDLLVINKARGIFCCASASRFISHLTWPFAQIDLAPHVNASLEVMARDSGKMRGSGPTVFASVKQGKGVEDVAELILGAWKAAGSPGTPGGINESQ